MAIRGPKPKNSSRLHRESRAQGWQDVENVPYAGRVPSLPRTRVIMGKDGRPGAPVPLHKLTRDWWKAITAMPHCALWSPSDWSFARTTALVADMAYRGNVSAATELRNRERIMGTTSGARRDLRINYVDPAPVSAVPDAMPEPNLAELYGG